MTAASNPKPPTPDELHELEERIAIAQEGSRDAEGRPVVIDVVRRDVLSGELKQDQEVGR